MGKVIDLRKFKTTDSKKDLHTNVIKSNWDGLVLINKDFTPPLREIKPKRKGR